MKEKIKLIVVFGLPGSGKSFFAEKLFNTTNWSHLNSDKIRMEMFAKRTYSNEEKKLVYQSMLNKSKTYLMEGKSIIVDATFSQSFWRKSFKDLAIECYAKASFVLVTANENEIKERLKRKRTYSEADFSIFMDLKNSFEAIEEEHLKLNSSELTIEQMITKSLNYFKKL